MPFTDQDPIAPLENLLNQAVSEAVSTAATGVDTTRPIKTYKWANDAARTSQTGMTAGDIGYQTNTDTVYRYSGTLWAIVSAPTNRQLDTTNSTVNVVTQIGIGKVTGNNSSQVGESLTFPIAFTSIPVPQVTTIGSRPTGAFNTASLALTSAYSVASGTSPSAMTVTLTAVGNLTSVNDYYFSWTATGTI